jgi:hypothetical protein
VRIEASRMVKIDDEFATVAEFRHIFPSFNIESIDDKEVMGFCESCEKPLFVEDPVDAYVTTEDDCYLCQACAKEYDARSHDNEDAETGDV